MHQVAGFLQSELPIRLAHRIQDLDQVPMMRDMPSVQVVKGIYIHSFLELVEHSPSPIVTIEDEAEFCHLLQSLYKKHSNVLMQMAKGAYELRNAVREGHVQGDTTGDGVVETFVQMEDCHLFLDRFYMSRVGIRVLAGQYLALREQAQEDYLPSHLQNYIGMIKKDTSPYDIVKQTIHDATRMCIYKYGDAPRVNVMGRLDLTFPYIPTHVHYILLELLKNAMRATMEHWQNDLMNLPPVTVIIADGTENEDVVIKIMDEGGGIPRSQVDKIWSYLFTTASPSVQEAFIGQKQRQDHLYTSTSPIAGLGYGAPMSRAYARYFGGDLDVISMEGYGTDAFCHLARLGDKAPLTV
jgi:pyruvate dehydrogenase kinase 2/3/4